LPKPILLTKLLKYAFTHEAMLGMTNRTLWT